MLHAASVSCIHLFVDSASVPVSPPFEKWTPSSEPESTGNRLCASAEWVSEWESVKAPSTYRERVEGWGQQWGGGCWEAKLIHCDRNQSCQDHHDQAAWTAYIQSNPLPRGRRDVGGSQRKEGMYWLRHLERKSVCECLCAEQGGWQHLSTFNPLK